MELCYGTVYRIFLNNSLTREAASAKAVFQLQTNIQYNYLQHSYIHIVKLTHGEKLQLKSFNDSASVNVVGRIFGQITVPQ